MSTPALAHHEEAIRASDADREKALDLLRDHWLAGRLTLAEYEQRCEEATGARFLDDLRRALRELPYPPPEQALPLARPLSPPTQTGAILSVVFGALSLLAVVGSLGMLFLLTLPASTWAWAGGRRARRGGSRDVRLLGTIGEVLGILATALGCLALMACAVIVGAV